MESLVGRKMKCKWTIILTVVCFVNIKRCENIQYVKIDSSRVFTFDVCQSINVNLVVASINFVDYVRMGKPGFKSSQSLYYSKLHLPNLCRIGRVVLYGQNWLLTKNDFCFRRYRQLLYLIKKISNVAVSYLK